MISQNRLRVLARKLGVRQGYAEKNYVNSWLLWGIFTSNYGENLIGLVIGVVRSVERCLCSIH
ncbi:hypothetical protein C474_13554 [Halogeometricum pallidum JCM 14848]|uniref:Uncharacterized protein n=1 Tax=Halogeometricum pallidum JCM 14848 TaxID=1227487 RepID=M0D0Y7_HALPD|nr:hypothetical protein C474_13554 [Halogeometricum pallidum JCM 14848]